ncbi:MAG: hypothetical protein R2809_06630 [Flavobacteriales bacterium]
MKNIGRKLLVLMFLMAFSFASFAQCAMCRASAESATENVDKGIGEGLNSGILYLMGVPYVLLAVVGMVFFRKKIGALLKS